MILAVVGPGAARRATVAVNLGATLDAAVVDVDGALADLPAPRGPDLHDILADRAAPFEAVREIGWLRLLPCWRPLARLPAGDRTALPGVLEAVASEYGSVLVDCPAGTGAGVGPVLRAAAAVVVVTAPAPTALSVAMRASARARAFDAPPRAIVVDRADGRVSTDAVGALLGEPVVAVSRSPRVAAATRHGLPVGAVAPGDDASHTFERLAARVQRSCRS